MYLLKNMYAKKRIRKDLSITFKKEVIQPQVPLRLPCYDFTPVIKSTVGAPLPEGLGLRLKVDSTPMV